MTTSAGAPVVDVDGHVLEPADTWLKYLEPSYRDRAIRIAEDEHGYEVLLIDGQPLKTLRGSARRARRHRDGRLATADARADDLRRGQPGRCATIPSSGCASWIARASTSCCSIPPSASAGRDTSPTAGWPPPTRAPTTAGWPTSAAPTRRRLYPVAHISLLDPEGAVEETIRARRDGCVGIFLSPDLAARGGRHFDDPIFARFWETAQGARDADRLSRGGARSPVVPAVAAPRSVRCAVRHRVPGHRRDGGLHADAGLRHVRALPDASSARCWRPAPTGSRPGSTGSTTSTAS